MGGFGGWGYCNFQSHACLHWHVYSSHLTWFREILKYSWLDLWLEKHLTWPPLWSITDVNKCRVLSRWLRGDIICFVSILLFLAFWGDNREQRLASKNDLYSYRVFTRFFLIFLSSWETIGRGCFGVFACFLLKWNRNWLFFANQTFSINVE